MDTVDHNDKKALELFCMKAEEINRNSIIKRGATSTKLKMTYELGKGTSVTLAGPEWESLVALATIIRQFYSPKEAIFFNRIYNIVWKYIRDSTPEVRTRAQSAMNGFKQITSVSPIAFVIAGHKIKPVEVLDLWFNAKIFHSDVEKLEQFRVLENTPAFPFLKLVYQTTLIELTNLILWFCGFIKSEVLTLDSV
jgi:hypothetical protein